MKTSSESRWNMQHKVANANQHSTLSNRLYKMLNKHKRAIVENKSKTVKRG